MKENLKNEKKPTRELERIEVDGGLVSLKTADQLKDTCVQILRENPDAVAKDVVLALGGIVKDDYSPSTAMLKAFDLAKVEIKHAASA